MAKPNRAVTTDLVAATAATAAAMKDTSSASSYRESLDSSLELSLKSVDELRKIAASQAETVDVDTVERLNGIQKELTFDTLKLAKSKNEFKKECNEANSAYLKKVKQNDCFIDNSFLLKWEIQTFNNNQQWNDLRRLLNEIPESKIKDITPVIKDDDTLQDVAMEGVESDGEPRGSLSLPASDYDFIKSLDVPVDAIHEALWNGSDVPGENRETDQFLIPDDANERIKTILSASDIKKFRLVQLHDKYYQRKITLLKQTERKWRSELNKIKGFVSNDVNRMKNELSNKLELENQHDQDVERERLLELNRENEIDYADGIDDGDEVEEGDEGEEGDDAEEGEEGDDVDDVEEDAEDGEAEAKVAVDVEQGVAAEPEDKALGETCHAEDGDRHDAAEPPVAGDPGVPGATQALAATPPADSHNPASDHEQLVQHRPPEEEEEVDAEIEE